MDCYGKQFQTERTYTLIIRLRHNVIKTGIRMISLSYSRISLADIAEKLRLDSSEDAEYIVAKVMVSHVCHVVEVWEGVLFVMVVAAVMFCFLGNQRWCDRSHH